jgi:putative phosphoribosyl transferase
MTGRLFVDRRAAGRRLAEALGALLRKHPEITDPVLLALPRGGVPVALEVARALRAPLDLVMVRKIGVPWQTELAAAAVVDGDEPQLVVNRGVAAQAGMTAADLEDAERRELAEIGRRRRLYLGGRDAVPVEGRDAVVIDDGVATGATVRAALLGVRRRRPRICAPPGVGRYQSVFHRRADRSGRPCVLSRLERRSAADEQERRGHLRARANPGELDPPSLHPDADGGKSPALHRG